MKLRPIILFTLFIALGLSSRADKLDRLRTSKKIIRMERAQAPYFAIQIIALRQPPQAPQFFRQIEMAREYSCKDGYIRYCVGGFNTYDEAKSALDDVKAKGYSQAFVVNTCDYLPDGNASGYSSGKKKEIDPNKTYTVQLSAFRFPVYLSYFKNMDDMMEFRMKDKIFRYTTGQFKGDIAERELTRIKALGYKDAHLVELDRYLPFKIE